MPEGAPLRDWKVRGARVVYFACIALFVETILAFALGALYGSDGLTVAVVLLSATLLVTVLSLQEQIDAVDGALRGVHDDSDYSQKILDHLSLEMQKKK